MTTLTVEKHLHEGRGVERLTVPTFKEQIAMVSHRE